MTERRFNLHLYCVLGLGLALTTACEARSFGGGPAGQDASGQHDAEPQRDAEVAPDVRPPADAGAEPCQCPSGEVWRFHHCLPALAVGCGPRCGPGGATCATDWTCDTCGAASACNVFDCQPTCVIDPVTMRQGPLPDFLRLGPTWGPTDQELIISVEGWPFYIGALYYLVTLGDEPVSEDFSARPCTLGVRIPAGQAGSWPVWVSQYGGIEPWVLAGFYTRSTNQPPACVQPGLPCGGPTPCCGTASVPMSCQQGRCRRD